MTTRCSIACAISVAALACAPRPAPVASPAPLVTDATPTPATATPQHPAAPSPRAQLTALIDSLVAQPRFQNAFWGILITDPARSDTLYSRNADKLFMPASNMKI